MRTKSKHRSLVFAELHFCPLRASASGQEYGKFEIAPKGLTYQHGTPPFLEPSRTSTGAQAAG